MAMAVATVATSVAPAFAATLDGSTISKKDEAKIAELKAEIKGYLDTKYTIDKDALLDDTLAGKPVYTIKATDKDGEKNILSVKDLDKVITLLSDKDELKITVEDKGHTTVDGKVVDSKVEKYDKKDNAKELTDAITGIEALTSGTKKVAEVEEVAKNVYSLKLLNNNTTLELKVGSEKIGTDAKDVIYKEDAYGNKLDKDGKITTTENDFVVLGFKKEKTPIGDVDKEEKREFTVDTSEVTTVNAEFKVSDLYNKDANILTPKGNELVKFFVEAKEKQTAGKATIKDITKVDEAFKKVIEYTENGKSYLISISGTKQEIKDLSNILGDTPTVIQTLAGKNRRETSIEVSKAKFGTEAGKVEAKNVVLVSDMAIADGLAATPFAADKKAPILLTKSNEISEDVMKEIKRVLPADGTGKVYLIGGETVLSEGIEKALDSKYISYERIAGSNRQETSLKIAKKMTANDNEIFITGRFAEVDAMSVANIAAEKKAPILLSHENGLSKDQAKFVKDQKDTQNAYIVGGQLKVSDSVEAEVKDLVESGADVKRLAGVRRQETNAKVINEFYVKGTKTNITKLYVAKSDDTGLVDALPGGVLAAEAGAPVILATDKLDASQEAVLKQLEYTTVKKTQIGYGIASTIWKALSLIHI